MENDKMSLSGKLVNHVIAAHSRAPIGDFTYSFDDILVKIGCYYSEETEDWIVKAVISNIKTNDEITDCIGYSNLLWRGMRDWAESIWNTAMLLQKE